MILSNILLRTLFIKAGQYGTAFTLDVGGEEFLVTAKHLLGTEAEHLQILIFEGEKWRSFNAIVIGRGRGEVDVSVLKVGQRPTLSELYVNPTSAGLCLGQDVYFLGFPYKMWSNVGSLMGGMPCAFAKKGTVSAMQMSDTQIFHVDAINNEGFSGGPLFFYPDSQMTEARIAGVVSKFRVEDEIVIDADGNKTGMTVPYNTGFLVAYGIKHVMSIIETYQAKRRA